MFNAREITLIPAENSDWVTIMETGELLVCLLVMALYFRKKMRALLDEESINGESAEQLKLRKFHTALKQVIISLT